MLEYELQKKLCEWPAMIRWWHSWCSRMHSSSEMQKMIAQLLSLFWKSSNLEYKMFPPKQFLPQISCTAFVYASNWPTWSTKCFPPNNICSRIYVWYVFKFSQIDSATYVVFPNRFCYICCFLLGMRRLSLMQLKALAFGVGRIWKCSFKLGP